jgi:hypothetical protein
LTGRGLVANSPANTERAAIIFFDNCFCAIIGATKET